MGSQINKALTMWGFGINKLQKGESDMTKTTGG
jgi:hypothetical protein